MDAPASKAPGVLRSELVLWIGGATTILFLLFGERWLADLSRLWWFAFLFVWLFGAMLWLVFGVVRHADCLTVLSASPTGRSS